MAFTSGGSSSSTLPSPKASWSGWLDSARKRVPAVAFDVLDGLLGGYSFQSSSGTIAVREERTLVRDANGVGAWTRARGTATGCEYDICRLGAVASPSASTTALPTSSNGNSAPVAFQQGSSGSGFVALAELEALEREAELAVEAGWHPHPHVLQCHGRLVENVGGAHYKLLLYDSCSEDLGSKLLTSSEGGTQYGLLPAADVAELGQQLAQGLAHLHSLGILHGGPAFYCVVLGQDGCWKLTASGRAAKLPRPHQQPLSGTEWRDQAEAGRAAFLRKDEVPPEARGDKQLDELVAETDIWLLARLLVDVLLPSSAVASLDGHGTSIAASPADLADPLLANLWLLFNWLLAPRPLDRPSANEVAALLSTVAWAEPGDLLDGMPPSVRERCSRAAVAAARQLAVDEAVAAISSGRADLGEELARLAGLPLEDLRGMLTGAAAKTLKKLCENTGLDSVASWRVNVVDHRDKRSCGLGTSPAAVDDKHDVSGLCDGTAKNSASRQAPGESAIWTGNPFATDSPYADTDGCNVPSLVAAPERLTPDLIVLDDLFVSSSKGPTLSGIAATSMSAPDLLA